MARCIVTREDTGERCENETLFDQTDYCGLHGHWFEADLAVFHEVYEHFRMDVREYWSRTNFYLLVQGALMSVFVGIVRDEDSLSALSAIVGVFGLLLSLCWLIVALESVRWLNRWRDMTVQIDKRIDRFACCDEVGRQRAWFSSPEKATSYIPVLFAFGWVFLLVFLGRT